MWRCMQERAAREGTVFVAPYDDPYTIAGQGTIGSEIMRQLTSAQVQCFFAQQFTPQALPCTFWG